jgi:hypothetical protein
MMKNQVILNCLKILKNSNKSYGAKEKAIAGLKIFGKSLFNAGKYTYVEILPRSLENQAKSVIQYSDKQLRNKDLPPEKREKIEAVKARAYSD